MPFAPVGMVDRGFHDPKASMVMRKANMAMAALFLALAGPAMAQKITLDDGTMGGTLAGTTAQGVSAFKGIPYAAPPEGDNRWRAPQPVARWTGVRDASQYGHDCAQAPFPPDDAPIATTPSEDCLYLNVWKPADAKPGAHLPVMVWVHGGGFVNGGSSPALYSGERFAQEGVVFVSLNYRLGRFGFFAHPGLAAQNYGANFGFLDQIAALRWVQAHVAGFGGDPAQVTIAGESAGGMSMHMLLQSPLARGLFARAIIESGGGRTTTMAQASLAQAARIGDIFAPGLNAAGLRALPAARITGDLNMMTMSQPGYAGPFDDNRTLLGGANEAAAAGLDAVVPVLMGANSADGFPFVTDKAQIFASFGTQADTVRALYDPHGTTTGLQLGIATTADTMMIEPTRANARLLAPRQPVWLYRFAYARPEMQAAMGGAAHASEIPYAFGTLAARRDAPLLPEETFVSQIMHRYWLNFVKTGRPEGPGLPAWPQAVAGDTTVQIIDAQGARHSTDPLTARLDFAEQRAEHK